jgi:hypothetical protein
MKRFEEMGISFDIRSLSDQRPDPRSPELSAW